MSHRNACRFLYGILFPPEFSFDPEIFDIPSFFFRSRRSCKKFQYVPTVFLRQKWCWGLRKKEEERFFLIFLCELGCKAFRAYWLGQTGKDYRCQIQDKRKEPWARKFFRNGVAGTTYAWFRIIFILIVIRVNHENYKKILLYSFFKSNWPNWKPFFLENYIETMYHNF